MITKCKKHPTYSAKRAPRSNCEFCKIIWKLQNQDKKIDKKSNNPTKTKNNSNYRSYDYDDNDGYYLTHDLQVSLGIVSNDPWDMD